MIFTKANLRKPILVNEHGSWAMVFVPFISAVTVAGTAPMHTLFLFCSILFGFFSYRPLEMFIKARHLNKKSQTEYALLWLMLYSGISFLCGISLIFMTKNLNISLFALIIALFLGIAQYAGLKHRALFLRDTISIIGITIIAPLTAYTINPVFNLAMLSLWLSNALFFLSSAFYIHMKMVATGERKGRKTELFKQRLILNVFFQLTAFLIVLIAVLVRLIPAYYLMGFLPIILHGLTGSFIFPEKTSFKKIGIVFSIYSVIFLICISI